MEPALDVRTAEQRDATVHRSNQGPELPLRWCDRQDKLGALTIRRAFHGPPDETGRWRADIALAWPLPRSLWGTQRRLALQGESIVTRVAQL